jgi:hypothetical protein
VCVCVTVLQRLNYLCLFSQGLAKAFADLDTDGSGYLDGPELVRALKVLEPGLLEEEVNQGGFFMFFHLSQPF